MVQDASARTRAPAQSNDGLAAWPWLPMAAWGGLVLPPVPAKNGRNHAPFTELGAEWLDFVNRRLLEDFALPRKLAACKGPEEMWRAYSEFIIKMTDDYQTELSEFAKLGQEIAGSIDPPPKQ